MHKFTISILFTVFVLYTILPDTEMSPQRANPPNNRRSGGRGRSRSSGGAHGRAAAAHGGAIPPHGGAAAAHGGAAAAHGGAAAAHGGTASGVGVATVGAAAVGAAAAGAAIASAGAGKAGGATGKGAGAAATDSSARAAAGAGAAAVGTNASAAAAGKVATKADAEKVPSRTHAAGDDQIDPQMDDADTRKYNDYDYYYSDGKAYIDDNGTIVDAEEELLMADCSDVLPDFIYQFGEEKLTWPEANSYCIKADSRLVALTTPLEHTHLQDLLYYYARTNNTIWTAGNRLRDSKTWRWDFDGAAFNYTNWADGEANANSTLEHCVCVDGNDLKWLRRSCNDSNNFICEKRTLPDGTPAQFCL